MKKLIKDVIVLMLIISLVMNVRLIIYVLQVERDCDSNIELLEESNKALEDNNKYLKKRHIKFTRTKRILSKQILRLF